MWGDWGLHIWYQVRTTKATSLICILFVCVCVALHVEIPQLVDGQVKVTTLGWATKMCPSRSLITPGSWGKFSVDVGRLEDDVGKSMTFDLKDCVGRKTGNMRQISAWFSCGLVQLRFWVSLNVCDCQCYMIRHCSTDRVHLLGHSCQRSKANFLKTTSEFMWFVDQQCWPRCGTGDGKVRVYDANAQRRCGLGIRDGYPAHFWCWDKHSLQKDHW